MVVGACWLVVGWRFLGLLLAGSNGGVVGVGMQVDIIL
jgi:hypothetical protein